MHMLRVAAVLGALAGLTACGILPDGTIRSGDETAGPSRAASSGEFFSNRDLVTNPTALFDPAARSREARKWHQYRKEPQGQRACPRPQDITDYRDLIEASVTAQAGEPAYSDAPRDFARALNGHAFRLLLTQDAEEARRAVLALRKHADRNAWIPSKTNWSSASAAVAGMGPLLPAWQILRQTSAASDEDRQVIEDWLGRVAAFTEIHPGENSVGTQRGANFMLLGLMIGDRTLYNKGVQSGYLAQLRAMRPDGSFPQEVDRGLTALDNQNRNIGLMVYSAWIARSAGEDLFGSDVDGKTLDDAIRFLVRASDDNRLVDVYAQANRNPSRNHPVFRPNSQVDVWGNAARGWIRLYAQRFPDTPLTQDLLRRVELGHRLQNDLTGGFVTCYADRF